MEYLGPYESFKEQHPVAWRTVDDEITELVANQDLVETTARGLIVGSIICALSEAGALSESI